MQVSKLSTAGVMQHVLFMSRPDNSNCCITADVAMHFVPAGHLPGAVLVTEESRWRQLDAQMAVGQADQQF